MSLLQAFGRLYSVETLDTRFAVPSKSPPTSVDAARPTQKEIRGSSEKRHEGASSSRWKTPEFGIYGLVFLVVVPWMFYTVYEVSQRMWLLAPKQ